jgi:lipopolysaccharide export LptBFGC system permease protein LptF
MSHKTFDLLLLSLILITMIVVFSFIFLIPKGKEYRTLRLENKKEVSALARSNEEKDRLQVKLEGLESKNDKTIKAFKKPFNAYKFVKKYDKEFQDLFVTEMTLQDQNGSFKVYEVNATTKIDSPEVFYRFLDNLNNSDWIIGIDFPIHFERSGDMIKSSFTMKVHHFKALKEEIKKDEQEAKKEGH